MSTTQNRESSWTNPDGLVIGFGRHLPVKEGSAQNVLGDVKSSSVTFTYDNMTGVNVPVPAGTRVVSVALHVETAFAGGTSLTVGDGGSATGFIDATQGATGNLTAGAKLVGTGAYTSGATDTTAFEFKLYASADTIDLAINGTFTAGKATLVVNYV